MTPPDNTAGTGTCRPRAPHPHVFDPLPPEYGARAQCRVCHGEQGGTHLPTPRRER